jgi:hypothetical protein
MLMTTAEAREFLTTNDSDTVLAAKLSALETIIRSHTNNRFHAKPLERIEAFVRGGVFLSDALIPFSEGDTVQVTKGDKAEDLGLYTVKEINDDTTFTVNEPIDDIDDIKVTLVAYDMNIKMGAVNLLKWESANRDKVGIQSETISRHSVTYADATGENSLMGYPKAMLGFLKPYVKARF